jgi:hypothetical protein
MRDWLSLINLSNIPSSPIVIDFTLKFTFLTSVLSTFRKLNRSFVEFKFWAEEQKVGSCEDCDASVS